MKCTKVLNLAAVCAISGAHEPDKVWSKLISLSIASMAVKALLITGY